MSKAAFRINRLPRHVQAPVTEAVTAALEAGRLLRRRFRTGVSVKMKGMADIVTATDVEAQRLVERRLRRSFPGHGILAEEGLDTTRGSGVALDRRPAGRDQEFRPGHPDLLRVHRRRVPGPGGVGRRLRPHPGGVVRRVCAGRGVVQRSTHSGVEGSRPRLGVRRDRVPAPGGAIRAVGRADVRAVRARDRSGCGTAGRVRWTSVTWRAGATTATGRSTSRRGTSPRAD